MKLWKMTLVVLVLLMNLVIAQPTLADRPKLTKSPDYTEVFPPNILRLSGRFIVVIADLNQRSITE